MGFAEDGDVTRVYFRERRSNINIFLLKASFLCLYTGWR